MKDKHQYIVSDDFGNFYSEDSEFLKDNSPTILNLKPSVIKENIASILRSLIIWGKGVPEHIYIHNLTDVSRRKYSVYFSDFTQPETCEILLKRVNEDLTFTPLKPGDLEKALKELSPTNEEYVLDLDLYGIKITHRGNRKSATITSTLIHHPQYPDKVDVIDGVESLILGHYCAGINVASKAYKEGIMTAMDAIANNYD